MYEYACVETDPETDDCLAYDFVFKKGDESLVTYEAGSYESKEGEDWEPMAATFGTEYCLWAVVKTGWGLSVQELTATNGEVTVESPGKHVISYVSFYCSEEAAQAAAGISP